LASNLFIYDLLTCNLFLCKLFFMVQDTLPDRRIGILPVLRQLPTPIWILAATTLVNRAGGFVLVFLVVYLRHLGHSPAAAGLAVSAYAAGKLAAGPLGGELTDRAGARMATALSMFGSAVTMIVLWRAGSYPLILIAATVCGLAGEAYRPAISDAIDAAIPTSASKETHRAAYSVYSGAVQLGQVAGPALAGFLAASSYAWLFVGDAATSVACGVLMLAFFPRTRRVRRAEIATTPPDLADRRRKAGRLLVNTLLIQIVLFQAESTFPLWVTDHGWKASTYGLLLSGSAALILLLQLPLALRTARCSPPRVLAPASVLIGAGFAVLALGGTLPVLVVAVALWSIGDLVSWPVGADYLRDLAPPGRKGRWAGVRSTSYGLALLAGPALGTAAYQHSPTWVWGGCAACGLLAAVAILPPRRLPGWQRRPAAPPEPRHVPSTPGQAATTSSSDPYGAERRSGSARLLADVHQRGAGMLD
jgi:MFS family permease